jgi:hypothetical protein
MQIEQYRNGNCIEIYLRGGRAAGGAPIAWLHDGDDDIVIDEMGAIATLRMVGVIAADWTLPITAAEARMIDAARIPDINL